MQTFWAVVVLLSLLAAALCTPLLVSRLFKGRSGLATCLALAAILFVAVYFFGITSQERFRETDASAAPVVKEVAFDIPPGGNELPSAASELLKPRKTGLARICLLDDDIKLKAGEHIDLPATTVFEDNGPNTGRVDDPKTWAYELKEGFKRKAAIITQSATALSRKEPCSTVQVKMFVAPLFEETEQTAGARHIFAITDVIDYPVPPKRPPVEVGKLIDDISIKAVLLEDVSDTVVLARSVPDEATRAANCLAGAKKLAAHVGGGVGRQTSSIVSLGNVPAHESSFGCSFGANSAPSLFVSWEGSARPPTATSTYVARAGEYLIGAPAAEIAKEAQACVSIALKPGSMEGGEREFRGAKIECQAFARDGGGGAFTLYRRFGNYPDRPDPTPQSAAAATETSRRVSQEMAAKDAKAQASMAAFAEWWEDPTIPKDVKVFVMMSSRIVALEERCPAGRKHFLKVAAWAASAGVGADDIAPGGRYHRLMATTLASMRAGAAKESVREACDTLQKYD